MSGRWIELSQPWFQDMPRCPGHDPVNFYTAHKPRPLETGLSESSVTHIELAAHVGTHVDAPRHFLTGAPLISDYPITRFVGPAVVLDLRRDAPVAITAADLQAASLAAGESAAHAPLIQPGDSVLLYTGWAERFRDPSYDRHPYLSPDAADWLVAQRINLLGTDTFSPDYPIPMQAPDYLWPVHARLLGHDILVVENLGLGLKEILGKRVTFVGAPLRIEGSEGSPIAAVAWVEE